MPVYSGGGESEIGIQTRNAHNFVHKVYYSYDDNFSYGQCAYKGEFRINDKYGAILGISMSQRKYWKMFAFVIGMKINLN